MRLSQLLFFQVWNCCPPPFLLLLYFFLLMLLLSSSLSLYREGGGRLGWACGTEAHAVMHLPAEVWGEGEKTDRVTAGGETVSFWGTERKRLWERVSKSLESSEDRGTMLGIYARLMGPSAEYTEGQQGSACTFLFRQSTTLRVHTVMDGQPLQGGFSAFCLVHPGKGSRSSTPDSDTDVCEYSDECDEKYLL